MTIFRHDVRHHAILRKLGLAAVITATMCCALPSAQAALIAYEPFNYDAGALQGSEGSGSFGFSGNWDNTAGNVNVVAPSLAAPPLPTAGNAIFLNPPTASTSFRGLSAPLGQDNTTVYMSFLARQTEGNRFFGVSLFNSTTDRLLIGSSGASANWGIFVAGGGPTAFSSTSKLNETPSLLVLRIDSVAGNDTMSLYVLSAPEATEPVAPSAVITTANLGLFNRIRVGAGDTSGADARSRGYIDEIRIGTSWAEVSPVPEPGTGGLLIIGGLVLAPWVRRRKCLDR